jgi:hypothetical protein
MEWIVSRTLTDGSGNEVTVVLAAPYAVDAGEWACSYGVTGLSQIPPRHTAHGLDALQALLLAIGAIYGLLEAAPKPLTWKGGEPGDTGIPRLPTMAWGLSLRRHIENIISVEERYWQSLISVSRGDKGTPPTTE